MALHALKDLEHRAQLEAETLGLERSFPAIGPANVKGIEINAYAAELARVSVWIGEIQWMRRNGFAEARNPILKHLHTIECRDAILAPGGTEATWPEADVVIGNPPFLGGKLLITHLGEQYVSRLLEAYTGRVPAEADLVCYWFEKAGRQIESRQTSRVGLVATNSIRGGANRRALQAATADRRIFEAWSDEEWVVDGAAVRVSLVCFSSSDDKFAPGCRLDGETADEIHADLTAGLDFTDVRRLPTNTGAAFMGDTKGGPFDVAGDQARQWLTVPNPNARPNADVLKPWMNGRDVTRRPAGKWIVDFGSAMSASDAALYEAPYEWVKQHVLPKRQKNRRESYRDNWWRHAEPRQGMWKVIGGMSRYIATPTVAKHRLFVWCDARICPDHQLIVVARGDATTFGILHSRFHEAWSLRLCTWLGQGNDPRYTPTTTFGTFPFPDGLSPDVPAAAYAADPRAAAIADAANKLVAKRDTWLNPPEWVERVDEPAGDYPQHRVPRGEHAEEELKKRTLTNLYNKRPDWLMQAHQALGRRGRRRLRLASGNPRRGRAAQTNGTEQRDSQTMCWAPTGIGRSPTMRPRWGSDERSRFVARAQTLVSQRVSGLRSRGRSCQCFGALRIPSPFHIAGAAGTVHRAGPWLCKGLPLAQAASGPLPRQPRQPQGPGRGPAMTRSASPRLRAERPRSGPPRHRSPTTPTPTAARSPPLSWTDASPRLGHPSPTSKRSTPAAQATTTTAATHPGRKLDPIPPSPCGCPKPCRGWSGGSSVFVDESATACRSDDSKLLLSIGVWRFGRRWGSLIE